MKAGLQRWIGRVPDISAVLGRFPVPVLLMAVFTIILIFMKDFGAYRDNFGWLCVGLVAAGYVCVNIVLGREANGKSPLVGLQLAISALLAGLAWFTEDLRILMPLIVGAGILMLGNMAGWKKKRDDLHTWDFTHKIWTGAIFAAAGSVIYLLGILAIMAALKSLFGIDIERMMERVLLPIGLGFLAPLYWLSTVPPVDEDASELYDNPSFISKAVAFLGTWLLSPLTLIYALILIAYAIKIVLSGELPKGEIAQLTTPFLIIGTGTWLVLDPPFVRDKTLAKLFRKSWFFLSIPAALLLAVAVGVRIGEYGLTWERLALLFCVIWALGLGLWFTFGPREKRDIRLIPGLAAALMLIGAFTFEPLSFQNQKGRAVDGLKAAGIMTDAGLIKSEGDIKITDEAAARRAKGALLYLERNDGWPAIARMFEGAEDIPSENGKPERSLYKRLGIADISLNARYATHAYFNSENQAISVSGFETLSGPYYVNRSRSRESGSGYSGTDFSFKIDGDDLVILYDNVEIDRYDVQAWLDSHVVVDGQILIDDPIINLSPGDEKQLRIIVRNLNTSDQDHFFLQFMLLSAGFE